MDSFPETPFDPTGTGVTSGTAAGVHYPNGLPWPLGSRFCDKKGRIFILWQVSTTLGAAAVPGPLTSSVLSTGETVVMKASNVATNDVSDGIDSTSPIFGGVNLGTVPASTSTTTVYNQLFLVKGRCTVTATDGNVDAGDILAVSTSVDGACIEIDETSTGLAACRASSSFVGYALATDATYSCDVFVSSVLFG